MPPDLNELEAAIARARAGDQEAYRSVIEAAEAAVRIVVAAIVPERSQVEDLLSHVVDLRALRHDGRNHNAHCRLGRLDDEIGRAHV